MNKKESLIDLFIHDLTGPLSIVSTSIHSLLEKQDRYGPITDRQKKTLDMVLRNANKAQTFLNEIIEIYRSEEGLFKKESCSMHDILMESLIEAMEMIDPNTAEKLSCEDSDEDIRQLLKGSGVSLDIMGKYSAAPFYHDAKKIQQILRNLITNALKYRRKKVAITVSGDKDLIIEVKNDGSGIPLERQECVFERFSTLKDAENHCEEIRGLGFGLSCVKTIVETMSGDITLSSNEKTGTRFVVRIPPLQY